MSPPDLTQGYRDGSALVTVEEDAIADSNVLDLGKLELRRSAKICCIFRVVCSGGIENRFPGSISVGGSA